MLHIHPKNRVPADSNVRRCHLLTTAVLTIIAAAATGPARADYLPLPNASFELELAPQTEPFVTNNIDSWTKNPQPGYFDPGAFGLSWDQTTGLFQNTPEGFPNHSINMDGNQGMYMLAFPGAGISQDYNSTDWDHASPLHAFNAFYEAGKSYQFILGVKGGGGGMAEGTSLAISLYYLNTGGSRVDLNTTIATYTAAAFPIANYFYDYEVGIPEVLAGDAWLGQPVGVSITQVNGPGAGYWDLDNARVVPEPSSALLLAVGGLLLARRPRA